MAKASVRQSAEPRVRRGYFESRFGQLHVHNAIPPGGGFDEGTSLICLHAVPGTGDSLKALLAQMGVDRSVYAPDLPGHGQSDGPGGVGLAAPTMPSISDFVGAVQDFCTGMRLRQIDVLGCQVGALVAVELALALPNVVRRVVLAGVPELDRLTSRRGPWPVTQPTLVLQSPQEKAGGSRVRELMPKARVVEVPGLYGLNPHGPDPSPDRIDPGAQTLLPLLREFLR